MIPTPASTLYYPQQIIADFQRVNAEPQGRLDEFTVERDETLEQQAAPAEVLRVIPCRGSPTYVASVSGFSY